MKSIAIEIVSPGDEVLVMSILEAFQKKRMINFRELNLEDLDLDILEKSPEEINRLIEKGEKQEALPYEKFKAKYRL